MLILESLRERIMLHLAINAKEFTYLNYLAVMSANRFNDVVMWYGEVPKNNPYWELVKKAPHIEFKEIDPVYGIVMSQNDQTGWLTMIYMTETSHRIVSDSMFEHEAMYEDDGKFEIKDMVAVDIKKPELITPEYVRDSKSGIAQLIRGVLLKRVWDR